MIHITKGDPLIANPGLVVLSDTGYYNDTDNVLCASVTTPDEPACWYEAKFVKYGGMVYSISNSEALLAEIVKMDPASLFGKTAQDINIKDVKDVAPPPVKQTPKTKKVKIRSTTQGSSVTSTTTPAVIDVRSVGASSLGGVDLPPSVTPPPDLPLDINAPASNDTLDTLVDE